MSVPCQADGESLYKKLHEAITGIQVSLVSKSIDNLKILVR